MFTRTLLHRTSLSPIGWLNSRIQNVASKMHSLMDRPSIIIADENIQAVERTVMCDRQISIRRLAEELGFQKLPSMGSWTINWA